MDRDTALRVDGMLWNIMASLDGLAHYIKNNAPDDEWVKMRRYIGRGMGEMMEISGMLHEQYPDIIPKELIPPNQTDDLEIDDQ